MEVNSSERLDGLLFRLNELSPIASALFADAYVYTMGTSAHRIDALAPGRISNQGQVINLLPNLQLTDGNRMLPGSVGNDVGFMRRGDQLMRSERGLRTAPGDIRRFVLRRADTTDEFHREVIDAVESIPIGVRNTLARAGCRVVATSHITAERPDLRGQRPMGWLPGSSWDQNDGMYCEQNRTIIIAQQRREGDDWVANDRVGGGVRHEMGHALDQVLGTRDTLFSESAAFRAAHERDVRNMRAADRRALHYYLQPGSAGRAETFADVFALLVGGPSNESDREALTRAFPEVARLLRAQMGRLR